MPHSPTCPPLLPGFALALLLAGTASPLGAQPSAEAAPIAINDNRLAAGTPTDAGIRVELEITPGVWHPQGADGPGLPVFAFAERGRTPQVPGPLLRVRAGQEIAAALENRTDVPWMVFGLGAREGAAPDSFRLEPRARRDVRFRAPAPGTYWYAAVRAGNPVIERFEDDSQLNGVIVVDPSDGPRHADERFFLISWWFQDPDTTSTPPKPALGTMVINGLSWPHTERFSSTVGDTLRWRWVNVTDARHPMHLHGFYFRVDARGDGMRDTIYGDQQRRLAVTEVVPPGQTMAISWTPERPGNWLFHCHFAFHISHNVALVTQRDFSDVPPAEHQAHGAHAMGGLALGIHVAPRPGQLRPASLRPERQIRLQIRSRPAVYGEHAGYGYVLEGSPEAADPGALPLPGPTLVLERNEPVAITLLNRSHEPAAVHWHGIELESFPDGVPGWSGEGANLLRPIPPGDSLTVRFTPPRAGTFMYHSHFNELQQIASGLYGAIVVLPEGARHDPGRDHVVLFSTGGIPSEEAPVFLNGAAEPPPLRLEAGVSHRLRFVNIMANGGFRMTLLDGDRPVEWRPVAKDGADLPPWQAMPGPASAVIVAGEIYDFEFTPRAPGELTLRLQRPDRPAQEFSVQVVPAAQLVSAERPR